MELKLSGGLVTAVYRPIDEQSALRADGRTIGARLGVYQLLQALPLGEWVPLSSLTAREQSILPALPTWTRSREKGRILRLADVPVRLDLLVTQNADALDALGHACLQGAVAPRMAVCPEEALRDTAPLWEADYHGVGLAVVGPGGVRTLVVPRTVVPESAAALHWSLAERVHAAAQVTSAGQAPAPSSRVPRVS